MKTNGRTIVLPVNVRFAFIIGLLLLVEGIWELFSPVVFGTLSASPLHGFLHLVLAVTMIWAGRSGRARLFLTLLGVLFLLVSALWFFPATNALLVRLLNLNRAAASAHAFVGALSLLVASISSRPD